MNESVELILASSSYCTIATVCADGSPWNVPVRFAYDDNYLYFRSPAGTNHGSNIERDGRIAVVVVDTSQSVKGAVYLQSNAEKLAAADETVALQSFNARFNNPPNQWSQTEYYRVKIGELDESRTQAEMFYFQNRDTA